VTQESRIPARIRIPEEIFMDQKKSQRSFERSAGRHESRITGSRIQKKAFHIFGDFRRRAYAGFGPFAERRCPAFFRRDVKESGIGMSAPVYLSCLAEAGCLYSAASVACAFIAAAFISVFLTVFQDSFPASLSAYLPASLQTSLPASLQTLLPASFSSSFSLSFSASFPALFTGSFPAVFIICFLLLSVILFVIPVFCAAVFFLCLPYFLISERKRRIGLSLSGCVSYFSALAAAGISPENICVSVCSSETDGFFDVIRPEFSEILKQVRFFGKDFRTAVLERAERTVSPELSDFLSGTADVIDSGGDFSAFLRERKKECMRQSEIRQRRKMQSADLYAETASIVFLGAPMFFLILFYLMAPLSGNQDRMITVLTYVIIPGTGLIFLIIAEPPE